MEFNRELGRGTSIVEMRQELRAVTVAFWMKVAQNQLDPGTPISYAVQEGGTLLIKFEGIFEMQIDTRVVTWKGESFSDVHLKFPWKVEIKACRASLINIA